MPTRVVTLPTGSEILASRIAQVNSALRTGSAKAVLNVPDWYDVALAMQHRNSYLVEERESPNAPK